MFTHIKKNLTCESAPVPRLVVKQIVPFPSEIDNHK